MGNIWDKLNEATQPFSDDENFCYRRTIEDGQTLEDTIADVLFHEMEEDQYSIISGTTFDSPGTETGYVSVAFIDQNGLLQHDVWEWIN